MRPIVLKGHERSITHIKYNREGDLLFSCSKDKHPTLWHARSGERVGTFDGHQGAVWQMDVSYDSRLLATASADNSMRLWDVSSGAELALYAHERPVRTVAFSHAARHVASVSDQVMGTAPSICLYALPRDDVVGVARAGELATTPTSTIAGWSTEARITAVRFGPLNETLIATGDDGAVVVYDTETGKERRRVAAHTRAIRSIAFDNEQQQLTFITASKDTKAKLWETRSLELIKEYDTGRSINCVGMSSIRDHIMLAGGQEAVDVALTKVDPAQFHVRIYHKISGDELGQIAGHFGPVNTLAYSPDGRSFASGGEDGYVRVHHLDASYFEELSDENIDKLLFASALEE